MATKKTTTKSTAKKVTKPAAKKATATKTVAKKPAATKTAAKKQPVKKTAVKKAPAVAKPVETKKSGFDIYNTNVSILLAMAVEALILLLGYLIIMSAA